MAQTPNPKCCSAAQDSACYGVAIRLCGSRRNIAGRELTLFASQRRKFWYHIALASLIFAFIIGTVIVCVEQVPEVTILFGRISVWEYTIAKFCPVSLNVRRQQPATPPHGPIWLIFFPRRPISCASARQVIAGGGKYSYPPGYPAKPVLTFAGAVLVREGTTLGRIVPAESLIAPGARGGLCRTA
jgi:hypothetical protein